MIRFIINPNFIKMMKKLSLLLLNAIALSACNNNKTISDNMIAPADTINQIPYPKTAKGTVSDDYFGIQVSDPYRWLENDTSEETKAWVVAENKVTQNYLSQIPYRDEIKKRLEKLWN